MTRHDTRTRRDPARPRGLDLRAQTIAASALAGGCLAVVALWHTASGAAGTRVGER